MDDSQLSVVGLPASACRAKALEPGQRGELALGVLTGSRSAAQAARDEGVSRKFVGAQVQLARQAVQQAFEPDSADSPGDADERVLFWIPVTGRLIRRLVLALILGCHSSYRGAVALLTEVLGISISVGTIHNLVCAAAVSARRINERADLSGVRIGAHDEIFQNGQPVLVGCDVASTYCYLLSLEEHRDADTWGLRLMELGDHGWNPEATIADGGRGLRAGQQLASPGLPCRGDVFHAIREVGQVATYLENRAYGTITACEQQERRMRQAKRQGQGHKHSKRLAQARQEESRAVRLAADVSLLVSWLRDDVLSVSGPDVATRRDLFDFLVAELERLAPLCTHRLTPVTRALRTAVAALADHTVRASSVVENINSRLRNYFFLRRHLSGEYLDLVRFYLNHHRFPRSDRPDRVGRSPHELLTGQPQLHWLDQLTNSPSHAA